MYQVKAQPQSNVEFSLVQFSFVRPVGNQTIVWTNADK